MCIKIIQKIRWNIYFFFSNNRFFPINFFYISFFMLLMYIWIHIYSYFIYFIHDVSIIFFFLCSIWITFFFVYIIFFINIEYFFSHFFLKYFWRYQKTSYYFYFSSVIKVWSLLELFVCSCLTILLFFFFHGWMIKISTVFLNIYFFLFFTTQ